VVETIELNYENYVRGGADRYTCDYGNNLAAGGGWFEAFVIKVYDANDSQILGDGNTQGRGSQNTFWVRDNF